MHLLRQFLYQLAASLKALWEKGLSPGTAELGRTLLRIFYQRSEYVVIANELSHQVFRPSPNPGLVIRQLTRREEISEIGQIVGLVDMARFYQMFDRGSIVFIACQDGQIAGCCWVSERVDQNVNRVQPPLQPGDACVHDLFVSPAYRSQGIGRALISQRLKFLQELGYKRAIGAVLKGNAPAFKINEKTGHIHIGEMSHTRILFWDLFRFDIAET